MSYLYLTDSTYKLGYRDSQIIVTDVKDGSEQAFPFAKIEGISVFGLAQLSTQLIRACIEHGTPILYYSDDGHYFGSISSSTRIDPIRHKKQILLTDDDGFCVKWSRNIISAKIANSLAVLESMEDIYIFDEHETSGLTHSLEMLESAESVNSLLGFEGNAAKNYFQCLSKLLLNDEFAFNGRSSRPPKDPFNSLLSFGYSILFRNIIGAIERHGLHPYFAFMHQLKAGHAALASDLIEEYRAPIVDKTVLELVNNGEVDASGFYINDYGAVYMSNKTMKTVTDAFSSAIFKSRRYFYNDGDNRTYTFQTMLDAKLSAVVAAVESGNAELYRPFIWHGER